MGARWANSVERRFSNIISRGALTKNIDDSGDVQVADYTTLQEQDFSGDIRVQNYGFTSAPGIDAELVLIREDGSCDSAIIISADHPLLRPKIKDYESCMWTKFGTHVWLKMDESLDVKAKTVKLTIDQSVVINSPKFAVKSPTGELILSIYQALQNLQAQLAAIGTVTAPVPGSFFTPVAVQLQADIAKIQPFIVS